MGILLKNKILFVKITFALGCLFYVANPVLASEVTTNAVISLVNISRGANGLSTLLENSTLDKAAQSKLQDMVKNNYFSHNSPDGLTPWYWIEKSGYDYQYAGENLAINFSSAEDQQKAWMNSPTHRKNILNQNYQEIGVAVGKAVINGDPTIITVQMFGAKEAKVSGDSREKLRAGNEGITSPSGNLESKPTPQFDSSKIAMLANISDNKENIFTGFVHYLGSEIASHKETIIAVWKESALAVVLAAIVVNPALLVWNSYKLLFACERTKRKRELYFDFYTINPKDYLEFLNGLAEGKKRPHIISSGDITGNKPS